MKYTSVYFNL